MTRITDVFYGTRTTNLLMRKFWHPSTNLYPTDTTEGLVYIAEDVGTVGAVEYTIGSMIVYKYSQSSPAIGEWITIGNGSANVASIKTSITIAEDGVFQIEESIPENSIITAVSVNVTTKFVGLSSPSNATLTIGNVTFPAGILGITQSNINATDLYFKRAYFDVLVEGQIIGTLDIDGSVVGAADILIEYHTV